MEHWQQVLGKLHIFVMVCVPLVVVGVAGQRRFVNVSLLFSVGQVLVRLNFLLENVALVIAASRRAVVLPRTCADPAELMLAPATGHMVAPLVFFDGPSTFGAGFRVGLDPQ